MKANEFRKVILFMANRWSLETAVEIFGERMGSHFFGKWVYGGSAYQDDSHKGTLTNWAPDLGTMKLFYEMGDEYMQVLLDYIDETYKG